MFSTYDQWKLAVTPREGRTDMADIKDFKVGDRFEFTVPWEVTDIGGVVVKARLVSSSLFVPGDLIHARILPRAVKVGDRVAWGGNPAIVKAIDGPDAWVRFTDNNEHATRRLSSLTLVKSSGDGQ